MWLIYPWKRFSRLSFAKKDILGVHKETRNGRNRSRNAFSQKLSDLHLLTQLYCRRFVCWSENEYWVSNAACCLGCHTNALTRSAANWIVLARWICWLTANQSIPFQRLTQRISITEWTTHSPHSRKVCLFFYFSDYSHHIAFFFRCAFITNNLKFM